MKRKIVFIIGTYGTGGKERQLAELIKILPKEKYELHLFSKIITAHYYSQIEHDLKSCFTMNKKRFSLFRAVGPLHKYLHEIKPDIVHSWDATTSIYAILLRFFYNHNFIFIDGSIRDARMPRKIFSSKLYKRLFINLFSDCIIGNSYAGINEYMVPRRKGICIHNGFNFQRISEILPKETVRKTYSITGTFIVGMVARFFKQKDWYGFVNIATVLLKEKPEISFICVGGGPDLDKIKEYAKDLPNIVFTGKQSGIESLINCFDVGILISNQHSHAEGISNSIMEYMALGKPVIANDTGGTNEIVEDGKTGYVIPVNYKDLFLCKILELYKNPELALSMGEIGLRKLKNDFNIKKMVNEYERVYCSISRKSLN